MALNHQHLRAFHAIALEGSISRAARRLGVTQPTLSQHLRALELRYNLLLFEDRKPPLRLTTHCLEVFELSRQLVACEEKLEHALGTAGSVEFGDVRLGSDSPRYAAQLAHGLNQTSPGKGIRVRIGNAAEVNTWLLDAQIDAAIISDPPMSSQFHYQLLSVDRLVAGLPAGHPLAAHERLPVAALTDEVLLLREPGSRTRKATEGLLEREAVVPARTIELHTRETIREAIALGFGVSLFYSSECPPDTRIVYRPLQAMGPVPEFTAYLICISERKRSPLMRTMLAIADSMTRAAQVADPVASRLQPGQTN